MRLRAIAFAVLMVLGSASHYADATSLTVSPSESERNEKALLRYLWPALKSAGKAGRIYYRATCHVDKNFPNGVSMVFPRIEAQPPPKGQTGLAAIQEIFRSNKGAKVTEGPSGIVRITIGKVPMAILRTRISVLSLKPSDRFYPQYDPQLAIGAIESAKEVRVAMHKLHLHPWAKPSDMLLVGPAPGAPYLPASLTHLTMDQALDQVATTFKDIVLYAACTQSHLFDLDSTGGYNFDDRSLDEGSDGHKK